jgi:hypothetical protein
VERLEATKIKLRRNPNHKASWQRYTFWISPYKNIGLTTHHRNTSHSVTNMRSSLFSLFLTLVGFVSALSSSGNRLLVVLEDAAQKDLYSKLWTDIKGKSKLRNSIFTALSNY